MQNAKLKEASISLILFSRGGCTFTFFQLFPAPNITKKNSTTCPLSHEGCQYYSSSKKFLLRGNAKTKENKPPTPTPHLISPFRTLSSNMS